MAADLSGLSPEQRQLLTDADNWNAWAAKINARYNPPGSPSAKLVEAEHRCCQQARADLLRRWGVES